MFHTPLVIFQFAHVNLLVGAHIAVQYSRALQSREILLMYIVLPEWSAGHLACCLCILFYPSVLQVTWHAAYYIVLLLVVVLHLY